MGRNGSVVRNLVGRSNTGHIVARSSGVSTTASGSGVVTRISGRGHDSGKGGEGTGLLSSSVLRGLASVVVDDGDNGSSRRVDSGGSNEGAGDKLGAGDNGCDVLGDSDEVDGGLRSSRGGGRSRGIAVSTRAVATLNRSLVTGIDDGGSTRGDGVYMGLTDGGSDHARSIRGLSDIGSGSRGDLSVGASISGNISGGTVVAVGSSGSSRERSRARLSGNLASGSGISTRGRRKLVVVTTSGNRDTARVNGSEASTRDNLSEGLRTRDNSGKARSTGNDLGDTFRSGNDGCETLRAREVRGEAALGVRDDSGEALRTSDVRSETLRARNDGSETLRARNSDSLAGTKDSSNVAALGDGLVGDVTTGANRDFASRGSSRRRARFGSINGRSALSGRVGSVRNLSSGGSNWERTRASDIARTLGGSRVSGVGDLNRARSVRDNNGARELDRLGNTSGDSDGSVRASSSSSDHTGSRDGRAANEATLLEATDEATASTTGLLREGRLDTLGKTDRQVGDEVEETTGEVPLLVNSETEVAAERASDIDTSRSTAANLSRVVEEREPDTSTEASISTSLASETKDRDLETTRDSKLRTESETDLKIDTSTKLDISTDTDGESLGDKTFKRSVDNLLGEKVNVDVGIGRELDVDTSGEINGLATADDKINGNSSLDGSLQISIDLEARDGNTELGGSEEFDGLMDGSRSREIDLDVSRDTTEANTDVGGLEEVSTASETDVTSDLAAGEVETEVDSGGSLSLGRADTLEEDVVLPGIADAARSSSVPVGTSTGVPLNTTAEEALETAEATKSKSNTSTDTSTKASANTSTNTETAS
ncbi:unnamed protein product [Fusarium venenatum]|uniref:Uncharacterized protein n=1 Tax=Fusarium venenatum TaxID=56646 RepID=A0A2L2T2V6_9HYPO|nr:uncharacterized protein FVRRES_06329 [Fusarium venenatum]CEI61893.1 unnamed protein product [Fusarium venenatum]